MSKEGANWREQGGNVDGEKKCYQELHDDGAQMMHGSTMGVRTGLSFYTSAAQPATPPYLGSLQSFTPENSGLEKSNKLENNICEGEVGKTETVLISCVITSQFEIMLVIIIIR